MYQIFERLLLQNGITAYKVSKETGVTQTMLSNWKNGKSIPNATNLKKIADYFGVTVDYLMTGKEPEEKKNKLPNNLGVQTIAAHLDGEELGENEIRDILNFIDFVKSKKK